VIRDGLTGHPDVIGEVAGVPAPLPQ
jgi:hypothetical protein